MPVFLFGQTQIGEDIEGEEIGEQLGTSVSISENNNRIIVGSPSFGSNDDADEAFLGKVIVLENQSNTWVQIGNDIVGDNASNREGSSVDISADGNIIAVGAFGFNEGNGRVRVFEFQSDSWIQIGQDIVGEFESDELGTSISLSSDGSRLAIGTPRSDEGFSNSGKVTVYDYVNTNWNLVGQAILGSDTLSLFGSAVAISANGTTFISGSPTDGESDSFPKEVAIFRLDDNIWNKLGESIFEIDTSFLSGISVAISQDGNVIAIGSVSSSLSSGRVRIFKYENSSWIQIGEDISGNEFQSSFGSTINLSNDGNTVIIGNTVGPEETRNGEVEIYINDNNNWIQVGESLIGDNLFDRFSFGMDFSSITNSLVIGAPFNDNNGEDTGHVRVFDLSNILSTPENNTTTFTLYPNPTSSQFNIQLSDGETLEKATIYNNLGQSIKSVNTTTVETTDLSTGIYFIEVTTTQGKGVQKLIIE